MSFPLIQNPAPGQQLSDTINQIVARRDAQRQQRLDQQLAIDTAGRQKAYFEMNHAESQARAAEQQQRIELAKQAANLDQARFAATMEQQRIANIHEEMDRKQAARTALLQALPPEIRNRVFVEAGVMEQMRLGAVNKQYTGPGVTAAAAASNAAMTQAETPTLGPLVRGAMARSNVGLQGSAVRAPVAGTMGGVTYFPDTMNYNAPSGGGEGRTASGDRLRFANLQSLVGTTQALEGAQSADPSSAVRPWGSVSARMAAMAFRKFGADDAADAFENVGLSPNQTNYVGNAETWTHQYIPNLPNFRMSVPMFRSVKRAMFPPAGEKNPEVIQSFTERRRRVVEDLVNAQERGLSDAEVALHIARTLRGYGASTVGENGVTLEQAAAQMSAVGRGNGGAMPGSGMPMQNQGSGQVTGMTAPVPRLHPRFK